jgi:hypothetical protein
VVNADIPGTWFSGGDATFLSPEEAAYGHDLIDSHLLVPTLLADDHALLGCVRERHLVRSRPLQPDPRWGTIGELVREAAQRSGDRSSSASPGCR